MFSRFSLLVLCFCCASVCAKICRSTDIRTHVGQFDKLKNCTKVVGFLKLVLLEDVPYYPSFPELREITGYLLVFFVTNVYDLGDIFPNLLVIRGNILLQENSLIIHHNNRMKQIGLSNLREIQRGNVHIGKCPNLCYVHTVNWTALGTSLSTYADIPKCQNEECAPDCEGQCWAPGKCQKHFNNCHPECLGCTKPNSSKDCLVCKNLKNMDTCVSSCPKDKFISEEILECVTEEECKNLNLPGNRWIFNRWCILSNSCPENYEFVNNTCKPCLGSCTKICPGASLEAKEHIDSLKGCTHIDGHLEFRNITDVYVLDQLEASLSSVREIDGCFKVARSDAISSLQFMKNLQRIGGRDKHKQCNNHTVFIYENANLKKLFDVERIETSADVSIGFHNNPELCLSEIQKFATILGISKTNFDQILRNEKFISPYSNGDRASCADISLNITFTEINPTNVTLEWEPYNKGNVTVIGYTIFYILQSIFAKEDDNDVSSNMCSSNGLMSRFISNNSIQLTKLQRFSAYVYWIKVYHIQADNRSGVAGSTEKHNFTTLSDDPDRPLSFEIKAVSSTALKLTWEPPDHINGNLAYYQLIAFLEKDDPKFVSKRNYCIHQHVISSVKEEVKPPFKKWLNQTENGTCVCETNIFKIDDIFCGPLNPSQSFSNEDCNKYMYDVVDKSKMANEALLEVESVANDERKHKVSKKYLLENESGARIPPNTTVTDIKLLANETNFVLKGLKPFTTYIILFSACNEEFRGKPQCSAVLFSAERTLANISADQVSNLNLKFLRANDISLTWQDPPNPNGMIVAYNIEYKSTDSSSVNVPDCLTWTQHVKNNFIYQIQDLDPGLYTIRVRPVSLHGPGIYSRTITFQIKSPLNIWVIYLLVCIVFVISVVAVIIYLWYKKKNTFDTVHLITSINPDYASVVYIEDEWEMSRNDIKINEVLGQGSFGQVHSGYIKSKKLPCAVKILNRVDNPSWKVEFLNEASVMKKFSEAHHVVKLYGVVSRGDPSLVVMELMERGDLKEYLRKSRESSQSISSPEIYLMAAQIADGMTYLAAKKFVHRDLAARNCMVAADRTVKIGDFGMTKDIYETDYYRQGKKGLLPVRWMAPESLADGIYSSESDVYGYGIVLWEMVTLAEQPYQGLANEQVVDFIISNGKLGRPFGCPDVLWEIMVACWNTKPKYRPLFSGIVQKLEPLVGPSFALVSFYHSRQGREYRMNYRSGNIEPATNEQDPYHYHYYLSDEDDVLMPYDEDMYPLNTRTFRVRPAGPSNIRTQPSESITP